MTMQPATNHITLMLSATYGAVGTAWLNFVRGAYKHRAHEMWAQSHSNPCGRALALRPAARCANHVTRRRQGVAQVGCTGGRPSVAVHTPTRESGKARGCEGERRPVRPCAAVRHVYSTPRVRQGVGSLDPVMRPGRMGYRPTREAVGRVRARIGRAMEHKE